MPFTKGYTPWNKGKTGVCTEETRRKMSEAKKGKHRTEGVKKKISEARKGKHFSDGTKQKMSVSHKGKHYSEEHKRKISETLLASPPFYGKHHTEETKKKLSEINRGKHHTEETRRKLSETFRGQKHPMYGKYHTEDAKRKLSEINKGKKKSLEVRKKMSEAQNHPDVKKKKSEKAKKLWQNPEFASKVLTAFSQKPNKKELFTLSLIEALIPHKFIYVGRGDVVIGGKCPDFISVDDSKKIIEFFGDYWHDGDNGISRIDHFKQFGYQTLVIRESELSDLPKLLKNLGVSLKEK